MARIVPWLVTAMALAVLVASPTVSSADEHAADAYYNQLSASDSYYTLNVAEGSMTVRVEITIQSADGELGTVFFWAMPTAEDVVVTIDGEVQETDIIQGDKETGLLTQIVVLLPSPIVGAQRTQAVLTYDVAPHVGDSVQMEPGIMELAFTGQGIGSFILLDLPLDADNYVDPGCVLAASQPTSTDGVGFERYVCGEAALVALNFDDPGVIRDCARLDDRCRQRVLVDPYSAYVQSVTDESKRGLLQAEVELGDRTVHLELLYFLADSEWAERQFEIARQALPLLEALFGFEYPFESLTMRESHKIGEIGLGGVAFPTEGELLITAGSFADDEVTVHELAHQWAGFNLSHPWLWEGQAQWATAMLAPEFGFEMYERNWDLYAFTDPLSTWYVTSDITNPDYWYGKAGAFWDAYEAAIGPEAMGRVLAATDDDFSKHPLNGRWFMDRAELESGANLDNLFLEWVWVERVASDLVEERRVAWDTVAPLREQLEELGFIGLPVDLQQQLDAWIFAKTSTRTEDTLAVLQTLEDVAALATSERLASINPIIAVWSTLTIKELGARIEGQRQTILAITESEAQIADQPSDSPAWATLELSRAAYAEGDFAESAQLAAAAVAGIANSRLAESMVAAARDSQKEFSADFFATIGLLFSDPDADLAAAEQALAEGDTGLAVDRARSALDAWDRARANGMKLLAIATALIAALAVGGWVAFNRAAGGPKQRATQSAAAGHFLEESTGGVDWREWEKKSQRDDS